MLAKLFLLFVAFPILELAILVRLGGWIGFWPTLALVLLTGALGATLARSQGARVLGAIQAELARGRIPSAQLVDGLMILIGGVVLLTPGLLSDVAGLLLLFPPTRALARRWASRRFERMARSGQASFRVLHFGGGGSWPPGPSAPREGGRQIREE